MRSFGNRVNKIRNCWHNFPKSTKKSSDNMPSRKRISEETKASIRVLKMATEIAERFQVSTASVQRVTSSKYKEVHENRRHLSDRKKKLTPEPEALILRTIKVLREKEGSFSLLRLMERTGIRHVTDRTVRRLLNRNGYFFLQAHKKGLTGQTNKEKRVEFAGLMQSNYPQSVWMDTIAFYLDGVSLIYKTNPMDQSRTPKGKVWRKKSKGLNQGCLAKGSKVETGGKVAKMVVAITHGEGVIICETRINGCKIYLHCLLTNTLTPCLNDLPRD